MDRLNLSNMPIAGSKASVASQRLARLMRADLESILAATDGFSLIEWRICATLAQDPGCSQKAVVDHVQMQQAQVSRSLRSLEDRGLILSTRGETDRRSRSFGLTLRGMDWVDAARPDIDAYRERVDGALSDSEMLEFLMLVERLAQASEAARDEQLEQQTQAA